MKIAITHTRYSRVGGSEGYIHDLVRRLLDSGHEIDYFCHWWEEDADPRIRFHRVPNRWKLVRFMKVRSFDRAIERLVDPARWDVVHGFSKTSRQDVYTDGSGCLEDYQAYTLEDEDSGGAIARTLRRLSLHQKEVEAIERRRFTRGSFMRVLAMSKLAANQIKRRYGLNDGEVEVIYNGVDLQRFKPENAASHRAVMRERFGIPADAFVLLLIGNDTKRKGITTLIDAIAEINAQGGLPGGRPITLRVVGKERHAREQEILRLTHAKGVWDQVKLHGPQRGVEKWYAFADAFALASRFDIFGNVVLEAMAAGLPVLVSSEAGASECVEEGKTGFVLPPRDGRAFAARIRELARDEARRREMGAAAREAAQRYSWDRHFKRLLEVYEEVRAAKRVAASRVEAPAP